MHGVAELMYKYYKAFGCETLTREECYFLGLVHDIGYMNGKTDHELNGGLLLAGICEFKNQSLFARYVAYHGDTPREYMERRMCSEDDIPRELILLWWADMMVESCGENAGEVVGFKRRLASLRERYGENSRPYQICKQTMEWLNSQIL